MDEQKPKPKIASIRTYAQDLTSARERRNHKNISTTISSTEKTTTAVASEVAEPVEKSEVTSLPPKIFARSNKTTPITKTTTSPQDTLNDLVKNELKIPTPKIVVPSGVEESSTSFVTENEDAAAATIITDTKKDRFKLLPSIFASIKSWFTDQKRAHEQKKIPRYTVAETSRRKGVIQKATSSTGKTTSADFASIQERIRRRKLAEVSKVAAPETTWSANTEPGFLLLEAPDAVVVPAVQNVVMVPKKSAKTIEFKSEALSRTTQSTFTPSGPSGFEDPAYLAKAAPKVTKAEQSTPAPISQPEVATSAPKLAVPSVSEIVVTASDLATKTSTPAIETVPEAVVADEVVEVAATTAVSPDRNFFLRFDTNFIAMVVSAITIVLIASGAYLYQTISPVIPTEIFVEEKRFFSDSDLLKINLGILTESELTTKLLPLREEVTRVTEVAININAAEIDSKDSLDLIARNLPPDFTHSLTLARPGFSSEQVPFLVLAITDKTIALGGLLTWEQTLYSDFAKLFSLNTPTPTTPRFIDASLGGVDIRVLKNNTGEEILLYGILNNNILITTDSLTFSALAPIVNN